MATSGIRQQRAPRAAGSTRVSTTRSGGNGSKLLLGKRRVILGRGDERETEEIDLDAMHTTVKTCRHCGKPIHLESLTPDIPLANLPVVFPLEHRFACSWACHVRHRHDTVVSQEVALVTA